MAKATYNATLEYDLTNTIELWLTDDKGDTLEFDADTTFTIRRADNEPHTVYDVIGAKNTDTSDPNNTVHSIAFSLTPTMAGLYYVGDSVYDLDNQKFEHLYSVHSAGNVYMTGKLNLVKVN